MAAAGAGAVPAPQADPASALADDLEGLSIRVRSDAERRRGYHKRHVITTLNQLEVFLIDSVTDLALLVNESRKWRSVSVDLEGINLGPTGEIVLVQLAFERAGPVYLVDVLTLGPAAAFSRTAPSLTTILENPELVKFFFDVRSDYAALYQVHGVAPMPVEDLQLHDVVHRLLHSMNTDRVSGLGYLIDRTRHAKLSKAERAHVPANKEKALAIFAPDKGGSWEAWRMRPLPETLLHYCTDARFLFSLKESYGSWKGGRFSRVFGEALAAAVERRVAMARDPAFAVMKTDKLLMTASDPILLSQAADVWAQWKEENPGR